VAKVEEGMNMTSKGQRKAKGLLANELLVLKALGKGEKNPVLTFSDTRQCTP